MKKVSIRRRAALGMISALCLSYAASAQDGGPKYEIKAKWKAGQCYEQQTHFSQSTGMGAMGKMKFDITLDLGCKVMNDGDEGGLKIAMAFTDVNMKMDMDMMGEKRKFDTEDPNSAEAEAVNDAFDGLKKAEIVATLDKNGGLKTIQGVDASDPMLGQLANKETLKQMFNYAEFISPSRPVAVGESWDVDSTTTVQNVNVKMVGKSTLEGVEDRDGKKIAKISFKTKVEINPGASSTEAEDLSEDEKLQDEIRKSIKVGEMTWNGTIEFDIEAGIALKMTGENRGSIEIKIPGQDEPIKMQLDQKVAQTIKPTKSK